MFETTHWTIFIPLQNRLWRMVLGRMCTDLSQEDGEILKHEAERYRKHHNHPINRYPDSVRERIAVRLDMIIRADPSASDGGNTCRFYSLGITTEEKLKKIIAHHLEEDDSADVHSSRRTLQRMVDECLKARECCIKITQSDHNAYPDCKTLKYTIPQFSFDIKWTIASQNAIEQRPFSLMRADYNCAQYIKRIWKYRNSRNQQL